MENTGDAADAPAPLQVPPSKGVVHQGSICVEDEPMEVSSDGSDSMGSLRDFIVKAPGDDENWDVEPGDYDEDDDFEGGGEESYDSEFVDDYEETDDEDEYTVGEDEEDGDVDPGADTSSDADNADLGDAGVLPLVSTRRRRPELARTGQSRTPRNVRFTLDIVESVAEDVADPDTSTAGVVRMVGAVFLGKMAMLHDLVAAALEACEQGGGGKGAPGVRVGRALPKDEDTLVAMCRAARDGAKISQAKIKMTKRWFDALTTILDGAKAVDEAAVASAAGKDPAPAT
jgi:hypothetical protein